MDDHLSKALRVFAEWAQDPARCEQDELIRLYPELVKYLGPMLAEYANAPCSAPARGGEKGGRPLRLGDYRIVEYIGEGSMGVIYKAVQEPLGRVVALKVLPHDFAADGRRAELLRREARTLACVAHKSIVQILQVGQSEDRDYIAMELVEGETLEKRIALIAEIPISDRSGADLLPESGPNEYIDAMIILFLEVLAGLSAIHAAGLVHRDLKPANILLSRSGGVKIADFGLAKKAAAIGLSSFGSAVGTPAYMSPEQVLGSRAGVDQRSDLFAVGIMLYELAAGFRPFDADSVAATYRRIATDCYMSIQPRHGSKQRALNHVIDRALEKSPDLRYSDALEFAADLRRVIERRPIIRGKPRIRDRIRRALFDHPERARLGVAWSCLSIPLLGLFNSILYFRIGAESMLVQAALMILFASGLSLSVGSMLLLSQFVSAKWQEKRAVIGAVSLSVSQVALLGYLALFRPIPDPKVLVAEANDLFDAAIENAQYGNYYSRRELSRDDWIVILRECAESGDDWSARIALSKVDPGELLSEPGMSPREVTLFAALLVRLIASDGEAVEALLSDTWVSHLVETYRCNFSEEIGMFRPRPRSSYQMYASPQPQPYTNPESTQRPSPDSP